MSSIIIAGGRNFKPEEKHREWIIDCIYKTFDGTFTTIVSGNCSGADKFGEEISRDLCLPLKVFPADWGKYGKQAGAIRNKQMADIADYCLLLPGGKGTQLMKRIAIGRGVEVFEYSD